MSYTSKSTVDVARRPPRRNQALPRYANRFSPKKFTQPQLFACLALKAFFKTDYRGVAIYLEDLPALARLLGLRAIPHWTTLQKASQRLLTLPTAGRLLTATVRRFLGRRCRKPGSPNYVRKPCLAPPFHAKFGRSTRRPGQSLPAPNLPRFIDGSQGVGGTLNGRGRSRIPCQGVMRLLLRTAPDNAVSAAAGGPGQPHCAVCPATQPLVDAPGRSMPAAYRDAAPPAETISTRAVPSRHTSDPGANSGYVKPGYNRAPPRQSGGCGRSSTSAFRTTASWTAC
jgi:hypothetical protein